MGLRDEAAAVGLRNASTICSVERMVRRHLPAVDPALPVNWPTDDDWIDVVNDPGVLASRLERSLRKRNIRLAADRITRHRRRECNCTPPLQRPL